MSSWFGGSSAPSSSSSSLGGGGGSSSFDNFSAPPPPPPSYSPSSQGGGTMNAMALQEALLQEQQRAAVGAAIAKLTEICFEKCVSYPDSKLSSSESNCIVNTTERYLDTSMFVMGRLMRQGGGGEGGEHQ